MLSGELLNTWLDALQVSWPALQVCKVQYAYEYFYTAVHGLVLSSCTRIVRIIT